LTKDVSFDKENIVKFWKSSISGSRYRNFLKDSSTLQDGAFFHSLGQKKIIGLSWKFCRRCIFGHGSPNWILEVMQILGPIFKKF